MFDYKAAKEALELLYAATAALNDPWIGQIRQFIDVGEFGLALDSIASTYLTSNVSMPANLFELFDKLANDMDLASDSEYSAVAELRKARATSA